MRSRSAEWLEADVARFTMEEGPLLERKNGRGFRGVAVDRAGCGQTRARATAECTEILAGRRWVLSGEISCG